MTVEEALEFVKNSNEDDWDLLTAEMGRTRKQRDMAAAEGLSIGEWVVFEPPDPKSALKGRIIKIARGRVTLAYLSQRSGSVRRVEVAARMVHLSSEHKQSELQANAVGTRTDDLVEQARARNQRQFARSERTMPTILGSVSLGDTFVFRTAELLGRADGRKPPFEGKVMTVVGFRPRNVNQVLAQDPDGYECLFPLDYVERALRAAVIALVFFGQTFGRPFASALFWRGMALFGGILLTCGLDA
jgi:hypothetical protein